MLYQTIKEHAPNSFREIDLGVFTAKTIALDASKTIYQFMVSTMGSSSAGGQFSVFNLTDKEGNSTGHLMGFIYKSLMFLELGIKPIWVFDGIPPEAKKKELQLRKQRKMQAEEKLDEAKEIGQAEDQLKQASRKVRVTPQMTEDAMKVLELMGVPVYKAVSEAEAECVNLLKKKLCDVVGSDDMDCLTFGCEYLIKGIRQQKDPVIEISLQSVLKELELSMDEFIDFCILCGCDYLPTVQGIGPGTALKLIKEF